MTTTMKMPFMTKSYWKGADRRLCPAFANIRLALQGNMAELLINSLLHKMVGVKHMGLEIGVAAATMSRAEFDAWLGDAEVKLNALPLPLTKPTV